MNVGSTNSLSFEPLSEPLVASACRLSAQSGWNQTEEDWRRLMRMECASVKVLVREGEVRASYSVVGYGSDVAWVGMILVDEDCRGGGWGKAAFAQALNETAGFATVGLDATNLGEPIYQKQGFVLDGSIVRWIGASSGPVSTSPSLRMGLQEGILTFDADCLGVDRAELLVDLETSGAEIFSLEDQGATIAYGVVRPGRSSAHLGPVVAVSPQGFSAVLDHTLKFLNGKPLICDVVSPEAQAILTSRGMEPSRFLKRMTRPRHAMCLSQKNVWCGAGFELG